MVIFPLRHGHQHKTNTPLATRKQKSLCYLCKQDTPETETHIYLDCPTIQTMKKTLETKIRSKNETFNVDIGITLNKVPKQQDRTILEKKIRTVAIYRQIIWNCRNRAKYNETEFNRQTLDLIFNRRLDRENTRTHTL